MRGTKMLYDTQQKTFFETKNQEENYLELISKDYRFQEGIEIFSKVYHFVKSKISNFLFPIYAASCIPTLIDIYKYL